MDASATNSIHLSLRDYCPCESGLRIERCSCQIDDRFRPRSVNVVPDGAPTGFAHPDCYLHGDANCSTDLSRKHYISESILELINIANGHLSVSGFAWQMEPKSVPPRALASKILCTRHNKALSPLDSMALRFYQRLSSAHEHLRAPRGRRDKVYLFNGNDWERWLLKVLCGVLVSGVSMLDGKRVQREPPVDWLDVLMGRAVLPPHLGMSLTNKTDDAFPILPTIRFAPLYTDDGTGRGAGALSVIMGFGFALVLANVLKREGTVLEHATHRPKAILLKGPHSSVMILFAGVGWNWDAGRTVEVEWAPHAFEAWAGYGFIAGRPPRPRLR